MTLRDLVEMCNKGYRKDFAESDLTEFIRKDGRAKRPMPKGDSLATFIVIELSETFDETSTDEEQIEEAIRVIARGSRDLENIVQELERRQASIPER